MFFPSARTLVYFVLSLTLLGVSTVSAQAASKRAIEQDIQVLEQLFERRLVGLEALSQILPRAWLEADADLSEQASQQQEILQGLVLDAKSSDSENRPSKNKIALEELKLRWLLLSNAQRKLLLNDAIAKKLLRNTSLQNLRGESANLPAAEQTQALIDSLTQRLAATEDPRLSQVLSVRLEIERYLLSLAQASKALGGAQSKFTGEVLTWREFSASIIESLEDEDFKPGSGNFPVYRQQLREHIKRSNAIVGKREAFEAFYFNGVSKNEVPSTIASIQERDSDSEDLKNLVAETLKLRLNLKLIHESYLRERNQLYKQFIAWQELYRDEIADLRGQLIDDVIAEHAFTLNNLDPISTEIKTVIASTQFWWWKRGVESEFGKRKKSLRFDILMHFAKLLLLLGLVCWLYLRRAAIINFCRKKLATRFTSAKQRRWSRWLINLVADLYVFILLLFFGSIVIDFLVSLGFDTAAYFKPILHNVIVFFLALGLLNYISPLLSQRQLRFDRHRSEVIAIEEVFEFIPKVILIYWLLTSIVEVVFTQYLGTNLLQYYFAKIAALVSICAVLYGVWRKREIWRTINTRASRSPRWIRFCEGKKDTLLEPFLLIVGGGIGVYRLVWKILGERIVELEMTRSFQAMFSRAILERKQRNRAVTIQSERFPEPYWRGFDFRYPAQRHWYVNREEAEQELFNIYQEWQNHQSATRVLIVGDRGIGKSEIIAQFLAQHEIAHSRVTLMAQDTSIQRASQRLAADIFARPEVFESSVDIEAILKELNEMPPQVIVVENMENSILRKVGGFDTLSFLVDVFIQTSHRHMWVTTFTSYAWAIAKHGVIGASSFTDSMRVEGMSEQQLRALILNRHQNLHGEKPDFSHIQLSESNKADSDHEAQEEKARDLYFRILWDYTRGNPRQALQYWKSSLTWDEKSASVMLFDIPEQRVLENLPDTTLMLLAALLEHNGLTLQGMAEVMNISESAVRRRIEELSPHAILFCLQDKELTSWHVDSFWTRAIENYLEKRQFLFRESQR